VQLCPSNCPFLTEQMSRFMFKKKFNMQYIVLVGCVAIVCYLSLVPVCMLLYNSVVVSGVFTLRNYIEAYFDPEFYPLLTNSFVYGLGSCILTFSLGTVLAWVFERTNTPFKKLFAVMALVPFIIPGILSTVSWILLLSPKIGMINLVLMKLLKLSLVQAG